MASVIHGIDGRKVTVRDSDDDPITPKTLTEYTIAPKAEIEIDGRRDRTVAQLEIGDEVVIGHPSPKEGFRTIVAKRLTKEGPKQNLHVDSDLSKPRVFKLEDPQPQHVDLQVTPQAPLMRPVGEADPGTPKPPTGSVPSDRSSDDPRNTPAGTTPPNVEKKSMNKK